jgi:ABC-type dipeptide/oligopeptide/nickel transport system permease component
MGIVLLESVFLLSCNLAVDLVCAWLDPRIRMAGRP